jgi:hypothetical protein
MHREISILDQILILSLLTSLFIFAAGVAVGGTSRGGEWVIRFWKWIWKKFLKLLAWAFRKLANLIDAPKKKKS